MRIRVIIFLLTAFCFSMSEGYWGSHSWGGFNGSLPPKSNAAVEFGFDIMETFDDIKDWKGGVLDGASKNEPESSFPKRTDGGDTPFNVYSNWKNNAESADYWIKDHRTNGGHIWDPLNKGAGKSLCMDLSKRGSNGLGDGKNWGPDRFGLYFGNGDRINGYDEMYLFFMVWMSHAQWPTHIDGNNIGSYVAGNNYTTKNIGMKFLCHGHGFIGPWVHGDTAQWEYAKPTYGWHPDSTKWKPHNNQPEIVEEYKDYHDQGSPCNEHRAKINLFNDIELPTNQWVGIEVRHKLNDPGRENGIVEMWYYDPDGTAHQLTSRNNLWLQASCLAGDKYNWFHIGGNNSNGWLWGPGMEPRYFIDDLIINGSRIGPKYFSKLFSSVDLPGRPRNLRLRGQ